MESNNYSYQELRAFSVDFAYFIHLSKKGNCSHEKHKQLFDEWVKDKLPQSNSEMHKSSDQSTIDFSWIKPNICAWTLSMVGLPVKVQILNVDFQSKIADVYGGNCAGKLKFEKLFETEESCSSR